jgi:ketosteroid isomerase-like protein
MPLPRRLLAAALLAPTAGAAAEATPAEAARALFARFVAAQNAHDFAAVRALLAEGDGFLWVSNGAPYWGAEALIRRNMGFHAQEVWRIATLDHAARSVTLGPASALHHTPLELTVGPRAAPQRFRLLITAVCSRGATGWRISALLTADANPEAWPG